MADLALVSLMWAGFVKGTAALHKTFLPNLKLRHFDRSAQRGVENPPYFAGAGKAASEAPNFRAKPGTASEPVLNAAKDAVRPQNVPGL